MSNAPIIYSLAILAAATVGALQADEVQLRIGKENGWLSPNLIGYNMATNPPGSNVASFLRHSRVGAVRIRLQARRGEDPALADQGVATKDQFASARKKFRSSTHDELRAVWTLPEDLDRQKVEEIRHDGIEIMACVTYSPNKFQILNNEGQTDWTMAWDLWRRYYAAASELASFGIRRIQIFNEPDHKESEKLGMDEYLTRMALAADAVQTALADEPSRGGPKLEPLISAPVTANIAAFGPRTDRPDTRDLERGWGEQTLLNMHRTWDGNDDPACNQFQQYAYQYYSIDAGDYAQKISQLRDGIRRVLGGKMLPIVCSETNVRIARRYDEIQETQDSPQDFAALGQTSAVMAGGPLDEIYFFRMTQSANLSGGKVKKNGTHFVSNEDPLHNIGGTAKTAEVIRMLAGSFAGRRPLRNVEGTANTGIWCLATDDALWIASSSTETMRGITVDLSSWSPKRDDLLVIDEVSTRSHGNVRDVLTGTDLNNITLEVPGYSVTRVRLMRSAGTGRKIPAVASFSVSAGGNNPTTSERLTVGHRIQPAPSTTLAYAGFKGVPANSTVLANFAAKNPNNDAVILHLYVVKGDGWARNAKKFPHLETGVQPKDQIEPRLVTDIGNGAEYAGAVLVPPGDSTLIADLTPAVSKVVGKTFGLLIVREPRFNGDAGEAEHISLTSPPALQVYQTGAQR